MDEDKTTVGGGSDIGVEQLLQRGILDGHDPRGSGTGPVADAGGGGVAGGRCGVAGCGVVFNCGASAGCGERGGHAGRWGGVVFFVWRRWRWFARRLIEILPMA